MTQLREMTRARAIRELVRLLELEGDRAIELLLDEAIRNAGSAAGPDLYNARPSIVADDSHGARVLR